MARIHQPESPTRISDKNPQPEVIIGDLETKVTYSFDHAYRKFKSTVQNEKILTLYKNRQEYEKPSVRRKRKEREAAERKFLTELREKMMASGEWEKRQERKEAKRAAKMARRKDAQVDE